MCGASSSVEDDEDEELSDSEELPVRIPDAASSSGSGKSYSSEPLPTYTFNGTVLVGGVGRSYSLEPLTSGTLGGDTRGYPRLRELREEVEDPEDDDDDEDELSDSDDRPVRMPEAASLSGSGKS